MFGEAFCQISFWDLYGNDEDDIGVDFLAMELDMKKEKNVEFFLHYWVMIFVCVS